MTTLIVALSIYTLLSIGPLTSLYMSARRYMRSKGNNRMAYGAVVAVSLVAIGLIIGNAAQVVNMHSLALAASVGSFLLWLIVRINCDLLRQY